MVVMTKARAETAPQTCSTATHRVDIAEHEDEHGCNLPLTDLAPAAELDEQ